VASRRIRSTQHSRQINGQQGHRRNSTKRTRAATNVYHKNETGAATVGRPAVGGWLDSPQMSSQRSLPAAVAGPVEDVLGLVDLSQRAEVGVGLGLLQARGLLLLLVEKVPEVL